MKVLSDRASATAPEKARTSSLAEIDEAIDCFSKWFSSPSTGNGPVSPFEREILRAFLWYSLEVADKEGESH